MAPRAVGQHNHTRQAHQTRSGPDNDRTSHASRANGSPSSRAAQLGEEAADILSTAPPRPAPRLLHSVRRLLDARARPRAAESTLNPPDRSRPRTSAARAQTSTAPSSARSAARPSPRARSTGSSADPRSCPSCGRLIAKGASGDGPRDGSLSTLTGQCSRGAASVESIVPDHRPPDAGTPSSSSPTKPRPSPPSHPISARNSPSSHARLASHCEPSRALTLTSSASPRRGCGTLSRSGSMARRPSVRLLVVGLLSIVAGTQADARLDAAQTTRRRSMSAMQQAGPTTTPTRTAVRPLPAPSSPSHFRSPLLTLADARICAQHRPALPHAGAVLPRPRGRPGLDAVGVAPACLQPYACGFDCPHFPPLRDSLLTLPPDSQYRLHRSSPTLQRRLSVPTTRRRSSSSSARPPWARRPTRRS